MKDDTKLVHLGRNPEKHAGTVNAPLYQTSTIVFPTLEAYREAEGGVPFYEESKKGSTSDHSYGLAGTPTVFQLQETLAKLEGGEACVILPSGLSAIVITLLSYLEPGDHLLVPDTVYGPTRRFCNKELKRLGIGTTYYDPLIGAGISELIEENTKLVFTESPGSLTFEVQDIPAISKAAHEKGALVVIDNSWATPLHFKPFKHGVDISIQAITKYISGHADLLLGAVITREKHFRPLKERLRHYGIGVSPADCHIALKGLRTLRARLTQHEASAVKVAEWLKERKEVAKVIFPALEGDAGHALWKRDFTGACGLFTIILNKEYDEESLSNFINPLEYFSVGASWGGYESLILPFDPSAIRTATRWEETGSAVRLHIGLEDPEDLIKDLEQGLKRLGQ
jgi:cystathionine beta-lyase